MGKEVCVKSNIYFVVHVLGLEMGKIKLSQHAVQSSIASGNFSALDDGDITWQLKLQTETSDQIVLSLISKKNFASVSAWGKLLDGPPDLTVKRDGAKYFPSAFQGDLFIWEDKTMPDQESVMKTLYLWYTKNDGKVKRCAGLDSEGREESADSFASQMLNLLDNSIDCDVTVASLSGREWKLHKCILGAASPVFRAMFTHNILENITGVVQLQEEDDELLDIMIRYLYSGSISDQMSGVEKNLMMLADRFQVTQLKNHCAKMLTHTLIKENALDLLILGDKVSAEYLKRSAMHVVSIYLKDICLWSKWIELMQENCTLVNEVLQYSFTQ